MTTVLLTGFAPFDGATANPSWQAASLVASRRNDTVAVELPCEFGAALPALRAAVEEYRPSLVVCTGLASGRHAVTPERVAINLVDARIPDNAGAQPIDVPVVENGPTAYFTKLPVKAAVAAIEAAELPAAVSFTAGTYVCNQVFYGLLHLLATELPDLRGGFVHVPAEADLSVPDSATALGLVIDTAQTVTTGIPVPSGTLH
ncbi:pyroglutamyl-peptidase [Amycolatopsis sulphurea]|uniref:Pyroglutamyl-peptidase I n=1 Tax=Amycolatopsis sulphurea TaxID=76022 RepID=A0A2A9FEJ3_9PSEU|nr:pyroglutamyl-peptidase I [Amycolatopsis sulphurea]PFG48849.1 pyroglutamyl-peptidase [Amycolatopsis sulphurea]